MPPPTVRVTPCARHQCRRPRYVQPGGKGDAREAIAHEPERGIRPPRSRYYVSPTRHNPSARTPEVRELRCVQDLPPRVLLPLGAQLLVVLDEKHPVALTRARHPAPVRFIPGVGFVNIDTSADALRPALRAGRGAILVNKNDQLAEDLSSLRHPRHRLLREMVRSKHCLDLHGHIYRLTIWATAKLPHRALPWGFVHNDALQSASCMTAVIPIRER